MHKLSRQEIKRNKPGVSLKPTNNRSHKTGAIIAESALFNLLPPPIARLQNTKKQKQRIKTNQRHKHTSNKSLKQQSRQGKSFSPSFGIEQEGKEKKTDTLEGYDRKSPNSHKGYLPSTTPEPYSPRAHQESKKANRFKGEDDI